MYPLPDAEDPSSLLSFLPAAPALCSMAGRLVSPTAGEEVLPVRQAQVSKCSVTSGRLTQGQQRRPVPTWNPSHDQMPPQESVPWAHSWWSQQLVQPQPHPPQAPKCSPNPRSVSRLVQPEFPLDPGSSLCWPGLVSSLGTNYITLTGQDWDVLIWRLEQKVNPKRQRRGVGEEKGRSRKGDSQMVKGLLDVGG